MLVDIHNCRNLLRSEDEADDVGRREPNDGADGRAVSLGHVTYHHAMGHHRAKNLMAYHLMMADRQTKITDGTLPSDGTKDLLSIL